MHETHASAMPASTRAPLFDPARDAAQPGMTRGFLGWLMGLCAGPRAVPAFGAISALESSLLPIPIDAVMIPLVVAQARRFWTIVLVGTVGSVLGGLLGYLIGALFYETAGRAIIGFYGLTEQFESFRSTYSENGVLAVVVAGITPIPFKLAAILGGVAGMRLDLFLAAAFGIRLIRFALIAWFVRLVGRRVQLLMERHTRKALLALAAVMIGGFAILPFL